MINVTKTYLPNIEKYKKYIDRIYKSGWLTNNGDLVRELERRLADYLGVPHVILTTNGTLALQVAYRVLELKGEVITTPFTFIATTSSLIWEKLTPIFADIEPDTFNIDPLKIENKINKNTSAILGVHVFGNICAVDKIEEIAKRHQLKVIYDAAHAFGIKSHSHKIGEFGDISVFSFHATKIFHTIEGGALAVRDGNLAEKARLIINFGIPGPDQIATLGINAKMNEFQAAMGLCVLDDLDSIIERRRLVYIRYQEALHQINGLTFQHIVPGFTQNYSYFPVLFDSEATLLQVQRRLNQSNIFPRRYFYPSLDTLPFIIPKQYMPVSRDIASRILCLPIYEELSENEQEQIIKIISKIVKG